MNTITNIIFLLLGSNLGESRVIFQSAKQLLSQEFGELINISSLYKSPSWGFDSPDDFLNQLLVFDTDKSPREVLRICLDVELKLGRTRKFNQAHYESRVIDVDMLYFGNKIIDSVDLQIPHPKIQLRRFTLMPLAEIAPDMLHPLIGKSHDLLLAECVDDSIVEQINENNS
ncbi:MAG: 2-amino-4-hydroxy-6-hydroxymethyldihydropteridine diphosphokinase [Flavobacteriales bacterium]